MKPNYVLIAVIFCLTALAWSDEARLKRASELLESGKTEEAKVILLPIVQTEPQNGRAHVLLGDAFRESGNSKAAEREYECALRLGERDPQLLNSLATVQKWNREYSQARSSYEQELELSPFQQGAREELRDLQYKRGLSFFGAYGGPETDSTTKGWQGELSYRGLNRVDSAIGASYADKFFYTRRSYYGNAYVFFSPTGYVELNLEQKDYNYPVATNPVPDANAYQRVPAISFEVGGDLSHSFHGAVSYEFFRPNFFFDPNQHADNHKVAAELTYRTQWKPLELRIQSAVLRDPDPNRTLVDKLNHNVVPVYGMQYLVGGGANLALRRFQAELLVLPNRDLDRSTNYSFLGTLAVPLRAGVQLKGGYIYDHYSSESVFTGKIAQVYNVGVSWKLARFMELSAGEKIVRRPVQNDQAVYITSTFRVPLR